MSARHSEKRKGKRKAQDHPSEPQSRQKKTPTSEMARVRWTARSDRTDFSQAEGGGFTEGPLATAQVGRMEDALEAVLIRPLSCALKLSCVTGARDAPNIRNSGTAVALESSGALGWRSSDYLLMTRPGCRSAGCGRSGDYYEGCSFANGWEHSRRGRPSARSDALQA